jgi:hypothetical protein
MTRSPGWMLARGPQTWTGVPMASAMVVAATSSMPSGRANKEFSGSLTYSA